ncbi:hypothetical protein ACSBR1_022214 [Camellia fascicularis]
MYLLQEHNVRHIYCHTVLEFLVPVTIDFVKLQYQGKSVSSFETHPKTMWVAITSLLMCCLAYDSEVRLSHIRPTYAQVVHHGTVLFGWLCSVSLASYLFSDSVGLVLYSLYILFLVAELRVLLKHTSRNRRGIYGKAGFCVSVPLITSLPHDESFLLDRVVENREARKIQIKDS